MKKFIITYILVFTLTGCVKDDLTKPAAMQMVFTMNMEEKDEYLRFNKGSFIISKISFEGEREAGEDYSFETSFKDPVEAYLHTKSSSVPVVFDVPQGIYQDVELEISMGNDKPGLTFEGTYTNVTGNKIPVQFIYDFEDKLELNGRSKVQGDIILNKDKSNTAEIIFDQEKIFQIVSSTRMLESAELIEREGTQYIIISKKYNEHIFNVVVNRIEKYTSALFN